MADSLLEATYLEEVAGVVAIDMKREEPFDREEVLEDPLEYMLQPYYNHH